MRFIIYKIFQYSFLIYQMLISFVDFSIIQHHIIIAIKVFYCETEDAKVAKDWAIKSEILNNYIKQIPIKNISMHAEVLIFVCMCIYIKLHQVQ